MGSPPCTDQSESMRLEHLESLPPVYTSTACDGCNTSGGAPEHEPTISGEDHESPLIDEDEREVLLSHIESISHECEPQGDEDCLACLFRSYQRLCVAALHKNELRITDVADVVALLGVFAPFKATARMKSVFQEKILDDLTKSDEEWPDVGFDESLVTSAVRVCLISALNRIFEYFLTTPANDFVFLSF